MMISSMAASEGSFCFFNLRRSQPHNCMFLKWPLVWVFMNVIRKGGDLIVIL